LITLGTFVPVLQNSFVNWDENTLVSGSGYRGLGWPEIRWMFAAFHFGLYQPLAWASLGFDGVLWWADPFGYHWTSLLLHVLNVILFYCASAELLAHAGRGTRSAERPWLSVAAFFAALGFAIHPLRAETIAWASARGELVAAAFLLVSVLAYLKANAPSGVHHNSRHWSTISIGAYLLALLAGPMGLLLPLILLTLDLYPLRRLAQRQKFPGTTFQQLLLQKAPYLALSGLFLAIALVATNDQPAAGPPTYGDDSSNWWLSQLAAPSFYLWKTILPIGLSPAYELGGWSVGIHVAASAVLCCGIIVLRKRVPALLVAGIWYLVFMLPLFRSEFPAPQVLADRHIYLASGSWALILGGIVSQWLYRAGTSRRYASLTVSVAGLIIIIFASLAYLSWRQVEAWRGSERLWRHAVRVSPSSAAYLNLASLAEAQGEYESAIASYRQAVAMNPQRWQAHEGAARLLEKQGKTSEAVEHYRLLVNANPKAIDAREKLAGGLVNQGEIGEALQQFRKLLELAPDRNQARVKLGTVLAVSGRLDEAVEVLNAAAKASPEDGRVILKLGQVMAATGRLSEATVHFREAVRLRREDAEAQESLGRALLELGMKDEASIHLREAVRILRSSPAAN
jgi:tetratricopeptide (TPR) repeat protein